MESNIRLTFDYLKKYNIKYKESIKGDVVKIKINIDHQLEKFINDKSIKNNIYFIDFLVNLLIKNFKNNLEKVSDFLSKVYNSILNNLNDLNLLILLNFWFVNENSKKYSILEINNKLENIKKILNINNFEDNIKINIDKLTLVLENDIKNFKDFIEKPNHNINDINLKILLTFIFEPKNKKKNDNRKNNLNIIKLIFTNKDFNENEIFNYLVEFYFKEININEDKEYNINSININNKELQINLLNKINEIINISKNKKETYEQILLFINEKNKRDLKEKKLEKIYNSSNKEFYNYLKYFYLFEFIKKTWFKVYKDTIIDSNINIFNSKFKENPKEDKLLINTIKTIDKKITIEIMKKIKDFEIKLVNSKPYKDNINKDWIKKIYKNRKKIKNKSFNKYNINKKIYDIELIKLYNYIQNEYSILIKNFNNTNIIKDLKKLMISNKNIFNGYNLNDILEKNYEIKNNKLIKIINNEECSCKNKQVNNRKNSINYLPKNLNCELIHVELKDFAKNKKQFRNSINNIKLNKENWLNRLPNSLSKNNKNQINWLEPTLINSNYNVDNNLLPPKLNKNNNNSTSKLLPPKLNKNNNNSTSKWLPPAWNKNNNNSSSKLLPPKLNKNNNNSTSKLLPPKLNKNNNNSTSKWLPPAWNKNNNNSSSKLLPPKLNKNNNNSTSKLLPPKLNKNNNNSTSKLLPPAWNKNNNNSTSKLLPPKLNKNNNNSTSKLLPPKLNKNNNNSTSKLLPPAWNKNNNNSTSKLLPPAWNKNNNNSTSKWLPPAWNKSNNNSTSKLLPPAWNKNNNNSTSKLLPPAWNKKNNNSTSKLGPPSLNKNNNNSTSKLGPPSLNKNNNNSTSKLGPPSLNKNNNNSTSKLDPPSLNKNNNNSTSKLGPPSLNKNNKLNPPLLNKNNNLQSNTPSLNKDLNTNDKDYSNITKINNNFLENYTPITSEGRKMKPLFLENLPKNKLIDTIWEQVLTINMNNINLFDILENFEDKKLEKLVNKQEKEEIFKEISLINNPKRTQQINIGIMKIININKLDWVAIKNMIWKIDENIIGYDSFIAIKIYIPDETELTIINRFSENKDNLDLTSRWFFEIKEIPRMLIRFETLSFIKEFQNKINSYLKKIKIYEKLIFKLRNDNLFLKFLRLMLDVGNILNSNNRRGNSYGFIISSLKTAVNVKDNKNKYNLLEIAIKILMKDDKANIEFIPKLYNLIDKAMNIDLKLIKDSIKIFLNQFNNIKIQIEKSEKDNPPDINFIEKFSEFIFKEIDSINNLHWKSDIILNNFMDTLIYLGEKKLKIKNKTSIELLENYYKLISEMNRIYEYYIE